MISTFEKLLHETLPLLLVERVLISASTLIALLVLLTLLLARRSAATRSAAWSLGIAALALVPVLPIIVPWNVPLLPVRPLLEARITAGTLELSTAASASGLRVADLLALGWMAGCVTLLAGLVRSLGVVARMTRLATPLDAVRNDATREAITRTLASACTHRRVEIVFSDTIHTPIVWGWLRPTLLLPVSAQHWSSERLDAVLRHELAHIARHDWITSMLLEVVRSIYWPNPLIWFAARRLRVAQEQACDDAVLRTGVSPVAYARHLLAIARDALSPTVPRAGLAIARESSLRCRVRRILDARSDRRPTSRIAVAVALLTLALALPALASINPWLCPDSAVDLYASR